jgi:hypothetical protein
MTPPTFAWLVIAAVLTYAVAVDPNISDWLVLQSKRFNVEMQRFWYLLRHNPSTPWIRYEINRNANRIAKEIQSEMENKTNDNL